MSLKTIVDAGLRYLTKRRTKEMATTEAKNVSRRPNTSAGAVTSIDGRCGACGGEIVEVKANGRKACVNSSCGKEAI